MCRGAREVWECEIHLYSKVGLGTSVEIIVLFSECVEMWYNGGVS